MKFLATASSRTIREPK